MTTDLPRTVVIVGGGVAGGRCAETLRKDGFDGRIVLVGEEPERPYERPPLSKDVLEGITEPEVVYLRDESYYTDQGIELRGGERASRLELENAPGVVLAGGETIGFDACLLATGGRVRRLPVPGADFPGVAYLRTLDDARSLRRALQDRPPVAVVGAGFIGLEVASTARTLGCEVTVVEALSRPLERVLPAAVTTVIEQVHRDRGVQFVLGEGVERIEGTGGAEAVVTSAGRRVPAGLVVVGVGIAPRTELAAEAGIECGDGIHTDATCRTSHPRVFAAGDVAGHINPLLGRRIRVEHHQNAQNQGVAAARSILGGREPFAEIPWFWTTQYEHNLQVLGHAPAGSELLCRQEPSADGFAAFQMDGSRIAGLVALDRPRDIAAARRMMERGINPPREALADPSTDLRDLLRD